ncbi:MAG: HD domain-containing phosphohydrolase, partial [Gammaproteobacteria bacterium]
QRLTNADGGTIYLLNGADELEFAIINNTTLGIKRGGSSGEKITLPALPLYDPQTGDPLEKNVASYAAIHKQTINIDDAYSEEGNFDFSGTRKFDQQTGYHSQSFLTIPMRERKKGEVIGVLQLINAKNPTDGSTLPFPEYVVAHVEALSSQAAVAIENHNLLDAQRRLMEAIISLMAGAIDAKSPYTGGHCTRVPDIAKRLVDAASAASEGPFADFSFSEEERYAFHISAWLHDCGKVTTPEYVVDKSTKLETIYNRIHEVRTRFEVLRRDAEIAYWRGVAEGGDEPELAAVRDQRFAELEADFEFVAECNIGGEFMDPERKVRLREIGANAWLRHFSDRVGLADHELNRFNGSSPPALPVTEHLLADRDDHICARPEGLGEHTSDNEWDFNVDVPEHVYNLGELYNLCIDRGTLTEEERFTINDHIVQTVIMLDSLPWPKELQRVPEYAGGHHEKIDGTGYPRGLTKDQMSVPARIMVIADIFEALTASDRPYKKAKPLSEALRVMSLMTKNNHMDPDLFELFLKSGVYKDYAEAFLDPEQIDEIEISQYL